MRLTCWTEGEIGCYRLEFPLAGKVWFAVNVLKLRRFLVVLYADTLLFAPPAFICSCSAYADSIALR